MLGRAGAERRSLGTHGHVVEALLERREEAMEAVVAQDGLGEADEPGREALGERPPEPVVLDLDVHAAEDPRD